MSNVPHTFIPGETAKAVEVNENFNSLVGDINTLESSVSGVADEIEDLQLNKADKNGNSLELFNVAPGVTDNNAVNLKQLRDRTQTTLNYIDGLVISIDDSKLSITISEGQCYDSTREYLLYTEEPQSVTPTLSASTTYNVFICGRLVDESISAIGFQVLTTDVPTSGWDVYRIIGTITTGDNPITIDAKESYSGTGSSEINPMTIIGDSVITTTKNVVFDFSEDHSGYSIPNDGHAYIAWVRNKDTSNAGTVYIQGNSQTIALIQLRIGTNGILVIPIPPGEHRYIKCTRALDIRAWVRL